MFKSVFIAGLALLAASESFAACPQGLESRGTLEGKELCVLKGKYLSANLNLTNDKGYVIEDGVFIGGDNSQQSVLRIQEGTKLYGMPASFLAIMRGSKIFAEGTARKPVVFTSLKTSGRKRGEWGGIVISGNAPINACKPGSNPCEAISEGIKVEPVKFGGNNPTDNSGVLRYVRVEFGGYPIAPDNELNGITFNAVGSGTVIDYVQVHMNADDGVEFFGGTAQAKHLVLTANDDDDLDWDFGWTGKVQFLVAQKAADAGDNGIEADNLKSPMDAQPRSNPEISNATFIGGPKSANGMLFRKGTGVTMQNAIVTGYQKSCVDVDDEETFKNGGRGAGTGVSAAGLQMSHSIISCATALKDTAGDLWSVQAWFMSQAGNKVTNPMLNGWIPAGNSPALGNGVTPRGSFFEPVDFIGAIGDASENWAAGWTTNVTQ